MLNILNKKAFVFLLVLGVSVPVFAEMESDNPVSYTEFKSVDIKTVIKYVKKVTGKNFLVDSKVKGKVDFISESSATKELFFLAFIEMLEMNGYSLVEGDGIFKILPAALAVKEAPYTASLSTDKLRNIVVIPIKTSKPVELINILRSVVPSDGYIGSDSSGKSLVVSHTPASIAKIRSIVSKLEQDLSNKIEVIDIEHADANEVVRSVKMLPMVANDKTLELGFDVRTNKVFISGNSVNKFQVKSLIKSLDGKPSKDGESSVIYLKYAKAKTLSLLLSSLVNTPAFMDAAGAKDSKASSATKQSVSIQADERVNALIVAGSEGVISHIKGIAKKLDIRRAQVLIEAIFVEVSADKAADLGVDWAFNGAGGAGLINFSNIVPGLLVGGNASSQSLGRGGILAAGSVDAKNHGWGALLRALNTDSKANVLATPSILAIDNEEAEILVGREVPFQTGSYTSSGSSVTNPFNTIERKSVGLKLKVKPQINQGNEVYLEIEQEVSDVLPKGEAIDIQTTKRKIKTSVIVGDGNMVVLGGLIDEKEVSTTSSVPGLGDIPGVGGLFSSQSEVRERVNLMVFLRPVIIKDDSQADYHTRQKYKQIYAEQAETLTSSNGLLEGLRPKLPNLMESGSAGDSLKETSGLPDKDSADDENSLEWED